MRVLLVAHQYWPTPGSATQVLSAFTRALVHDGHTVDVIACAPPAGIEPATMGPHGERIHLGAGPEPDDRGLRRLVALAEFARGILRVSRHLSPDLVISDPPPTAGWAASRVARRRKVPFVYYMSDSWAGASRDLGGLAGRLHLAISALERRVLASARQVIAATEGMARIARRAPVTSVTVVHNGVALQDFSPEGEAWSPGTGRPFFLYAGNAGAVHGAAVFAEAALQRWRCGDQFDLVFMGQGPDFAVVEELTHDFADHVHLLSPQPVSLVAAAYRGATGALSSLRPTIDYADARPIKSMTGLAAGCPAVYAGSGDFADMLRDADLGFVGEWSPGAAARALSTALTLATNDPQGYQRLRRRCADYAALHFSDVTAGRRAADLACATRGES